MNIKSVIINILLLCYTFNLIAQNEILVVDCESNIPIQDVVLSNGEYVTLTNKDGLAIIPDIIDSIYVHHLAYIHTRISSKQIHRICLEESSEIIETIIVNSSMDEDILFNAIENLRLNFDFDNINWGTFYLKGETNEWDCKFILNINSINRKGDYNLIKGKVNLKEGKKDSTSIFPLIPFHYALYYQNIYNPSSKFYKERTYKKFEDLYAFINKENNLTYSFKYKNDDYNIVLNLNYEILSVDKKSNGFRSKVIFDKKDNKYGISVLEYYSPVSSYLLTKFTPKIHNGEANFKGTESLDKLIFDPL